VTAWRAAVGLAAGVLAATALLYAAIAYAQLQAEYAMDSDHPGGDHTP